MHGRYRKCSNAGVHVVLAQDKAIMQCGVARYDSLFYIFTLLNSFRLDRNCNVDLVHLTPQNKDGKIFENFPQAPVEKLYQKLPVGWPINHAYRYTFLGQPNVKKKFWGPGMQVVRLRDWIRGTGSIPSSRKPLLH